MILITSSSCITKKDDESVDRRLREQSVMEVMTMMMMQCVVDVMISSV